jgi:hypothetical protein
MSKTLEQHEGSEKVREPPRDVTGAFMPGEIGPARTTRARHRRETDYLKSVVRQVTKDDIRKVVVAIVKDAVDGDSRDKNAAREWLLKVCLGGGKIALQDVDSPPTITKRR